MKGISLLDGLIKVKLYTGPIRKVYADNFSLVRNRPVYKMNDTKFFKQHANFFIGDGAGGDYENIELGGVLPNEKEARSICDQIVSAKQATLMSVLTGRVSNPKEQHRILDEIQNESVVYYYNKDELKFEREVTKKELKELVKKAETLRERDKNKNKK